METLGQILFWGGIVGMFIFVADTMIMVAKFKIKRK